MTTRTKTISYTYDIADIEWWVQYYGCPEEVEDKEAWAANFAKNTLIDVLTKPYKASIAAQVEAQKAAALEQVDAAVTQRVEIE